ncbi:MAG: hypothetical protein JWO99_324 [Candidatus Saccharibacteria bacterium]|nr:hypothetical protein [Candidatus Saccharibacteria bacterium]
MNKKYLKKFNIKDKTAKVELARAHGMIVLLVIALMFILALSGSFNIVLDPLLSFVVVFLLGIVGLISLSVVIAVLRKK